MEQTFAERISKLLMMWRRFKGMTQDEIAKQVGVQQTHWSNMEKGRVDIKLSTLERIVQGLQLTLEEFLAGPTCPTNMDQWMRARHRNWEWFNK